jgi:hypothetical protein
MEDTLKIDKRLGRTLDDALKELKGHSNGALGRMLMKAQVTMHALLAADVDEEGSTFGEMLHYTNIMHARAILQYEILGRMRKDGKSSPKTEEMAKKNTVELTRDRDLVRIRLVDAMKDIQHASEQLEDLETLYKLPAFSYSRTLL